MRRLGRWKEENDRQNVTKSLEVNRWNSPVWGSTAGHHAYGPKHTRSFGGPQFYKLFSVSVYPHMLSSQIKPGGRGPGLHAVIPGLIMPSSRLREAFADASVDRSLCWASTGCAFTIQQASLYSRAASRSTGDSRNSLDSLWEERRREEQKD